MYHVERDKLMKEEFELWLEVRLTEGFFFCCFIE